MRTILCLTCSIILASTVLFSQSEDVLRPHGRSDQGTAEPKSSKKKDDKVIIGLEAGLNINFMSQPFTYDPNITKSPEEVLRSGTGFSPEVGIFVDFPVAKRVGIQLRLAYDPKSASNTKTGIIDAQREVTLEVVPMETEASYTLSFDALAAAVLARIDLTHNLFVTVGPYLSSALGDIIRSDRLTRLRPDDTFISVDYEGNPGQFDEITREDTLAQNMLPAVGAGTYSASTYAKSRIGIELGIGFRLNLTKNMFLAPNARYQYMITELNTNFSAVDVSQPFTQNFSTLAYDKGALNSLAFVLQLGFIL